jgi:hypothetical protein
MATNSIDGVSYQVRIKWRVNGQDAFNVLNFVSRGSMDLITVLVQPILDCIVDNLLPVLASDTTLLGADVKNTSGSVAQEESVNLVSGNVGGDGSDGLPSFNAIVVNLRTTHVGRSGKGRMFLTGISEPRAHQNTVDATFMAAAVAFLACMVAAYVNSEPLNSPQFHWSVFSRKDNAHYPITSAIPNDVIAVMRSRKQ